MAHRCLAVLLLLAGVLASPGPGDECGSDLSSMLAITAPGCRATTGKPAVAAYIVGIKSRLLLSSKLDMLLRPLVADGFAAHVYMSLVWNTAGSGFDGAANPIHGAQSEDPAIAALDPSGLRAHLASRVASTGACAAVVEVLPHAEELGDIPVNAGQMSSYPPRQTREGRRVLARWVSMERLWNATLANERVQGRKYDLLMTLRDDTFFVAPVTAPKVWLATPSASRTLRAREWVRDRFIRDKLLVFGRDVAPTVMTLYTSFMKGGLKNVETENAEHHLETAVVRAHLKVVRVPCAALPEAVGMYVRGPRGLSLCLVRGMISDDDDRELTSHKSSPPFCERLNISSPVSPA